MANGREALDALERESFDVVLMDEQMPGMDGLEATRTIREKEKSTGRHQVIVALTGNVAEEDKQRRVEAGMDGFVPKPFEMRLLFETVEFLANYGNQVIEAKPLASRSSAGAERAAAQPPAVAPAEDVAAHLRTTTGGSARLMKSLTQSFLSDAPKRLAAIRAAIAAKDGAKLDTAAHALKGSVAIFGARTAVTAARNLEAMGRSRNLAGADAELRTLETAMKSLKDELLAALQNLTSRKKPQPKKSAARRKKR